MVKEAIGYGATIDEAKEDAISKLNASELDDIQFDVIAMPKKKVLGLFGGSNAQVRAFIEIKEKKAKPQKKKAPKKERAPKKEEKTKKVEKATAPVAEPKKEEPKKTETVVSEYSEPINESEVPADSQAGKAVAYVKTVLAALGCQDVSIKVAHRENGSLIMLDGEDISIIIGRRGETLDSLQYLAGLAANNGGGHYRIALNIGNYRERRADTLVALANRISAQVLKTGKSRSLEPMNPYERRIIHTAVQTIEGVTSASFGEGNNRRVVIAVEGTEIKPPRYNDRRNGGRRSGRPGGRKPSNQVVSQPNREPKKDSDIPLYGKIN